MRRFSLVVLVTMTLPFLFLACGGGGGGGGGGTGGPALTAFEGDWLGPGDDPFFDPAAIELTIDAAGGISVYDIGGVSEALAIPATFVVEDESSALITFDDGSEGGFFWDDAVEHMLFVDTSLQLVSVIEKDAAGLPAYAASDAAGSWAGFAYVGDGMGDFDKESPITITVANDLSFSGTDPISNPFSGSFNPALFDSVHGMYIGTIDGPPVDESIHIYLSPDKTFSGGVVWEAGDAWPDDYVILVLTRQ